MGSWKILNTSVIGTSHLTTQKNCEDYSRCELLSVGDSKILIAIASDGAGSAKMAEQASRYVCDFMIDYFTLRFNSGQMLNTITKETFKEALSELREYINIKAACHGLLLKDYAATFLCAVVGENYSVFAQVGDGVIISSNVSSSSEYVWVTWPKQGEYANTTYFVTDDTYEMNIVYEYSRDPVAKLMLLTDGLQSLALTYSDKTVHQPFADMLFKYLEQSSATNLHDLRKPIDEWLLSDTVNNRTNDDKTIILAIRVDD